MTITTIAGYFIGDHIGHKLTVQSDAVFQTKPNDDFWDYVILEIPKSLFYAAKDNLIRKNSCILGIIFGALLGFIITGVYIEEHLEKRIIRLYNEGNSLEEISAATGKNQRKISKILSEICQPIDYQI